LDVENAIGKRKAIPGDGPNGGWIEPTILFRHDRDGKPTVGSERSATGFHLHPHKPPTALTIRAETLSTEYYQQVKSINLPILFDSRSAQIFQYYDEIGCPRLPNFDAS